MPEQPTPDDVVQCRRCRAIGRAADTLLAVSADQPPVVSPFLSAAASPWGKPHEGSRAAAGG